MNFEEETFLTAYLDDELDPDQRLGVDSAMLSDPRLFEDLRDLTVVRDLVSGLARPAPAVDVSGTVVATIRRRRDAGPMARVIGTTAAAWTSRVAALVSAAAALVVTASIGVQGPAPAAPGVGVVLKGQHKIRPDLVSSAPVAAADHRRGLADAKTPAADSRHLALTPDDNRREEENREIRSLLESPNLRKVFIVTDILGGDAGRQVGDLIEKTPRRSSTYGRFTVSQGIVFDPDHPGEATVFAVVMDDQELGQFRAKLADSFHDSFREADARPEVVTELAEVGQVSVFHGTPVANVYVPEGPSPALKSELSGRRPNGFSLTAESPGVDPLRDVPVTSDNFTDRVVSNSRPRSPRPSPVRRSKTDPSVVLVWVATPRRE
jgi:hypothetical protein